jgi:hypothetical protein
LHYVGTTRPLAQVALDGVLERVAAGAGRVPDMLGPLLTAEEGRGALDLQLKVGGAILSPVAVAVPESGAAVAVIVVVLPVVVSRLIARSPLSSASLRKRPNCCAAAN